MRLRIEESIGRPLPPDEREMLERHLAHCGSCRGYREALLRDDSLLDEYASRHTESVGRVEEEAARARAAGIVTAPRRPTVSQRLARIPRFARVAAAVAAALAIVATVDFIRGAYYGPIPAFAAVLEKAGKAENVTRRVRTWALGEWRTRTYVINRSHGSRIDWGDSVLVTNKEKPFHSLMLYPARKEFTSWQASVAGPSFDTGLDENPVERLATWHKKWNFAFVRRARYHGKSVAIYEGGPFPQRSKVKFSTWVDLHTELPVRVEITNSLPRYSADSSLYDLRLADFLPPGSPRAKHTGWVDFREGEPAVIEDNFEWNAPLDTSLLSLDPPPGYTAKSIRKVYYADFGELARTFIPAEADMIRAALTEWISLCGNTFPADLNVFADVDKMKPRLVAKYNGNGVPGDEYRAAIHGAGRLKFGAVAVENLERSKEHPYAGRRGATGDTSRAIPEFSYVGAGCAFGDSTKPIFWLRRDKDESYWIIYADLHMVPSETSPRMRQK